MWILDKLVEQRIDEARARGDFDDLAGAGRPLELEDLSLVSEELRAAYLLLKNAGCLPAEVRARRDGLDLQAKLRLSKLSTPDGPVRESIDQLVKVGFNPIVACTRGAGLDSKPRGTIHDA